MAGSERLQRQIDRLLDQAEEAIALGDWGLVRERAEAVLRVDPDNRDARGYLAMAPTPRKSALPETPAESSVARAESSSPSLPTSFVGGRYQVVRLLGEGGKKRVYLARDTKLDREVAFALLKAGGLDDEGSARLRREAQAMARLGDHPHIVAVHDIGDEAGQPYLVCQYMAGGDVEQLLAQSPDHRLSIEDALRLADQICQALEHAHGQGIVHRDLKPGNVWLAADGAAKLGDFGLALTLSHSRLTEAGMMVGTVAYLAPEQALGGEVTARSDLYSLGALLYELVTGRTPFVGDESVAIITQHLHTPPIAPSWHRPEVPPGLEALILRLLEKLPDQRPASAAEVRQILSSIAAAPSAASSAPDPNERELASPVYRRTFIGREAELRQLQTGFDQAISGHGGLAVVVGEPGIGKTALCEQLATYVGLRGGKVLVGHCYEEGSLSLPYLPFVEALRSYVLAREPEALREELGTGASEVARIVSEIRDRVKVELRPPGDPDDDRWRLLQAVTDFLHNAGAVQPILLVLEDLHWADRGTLDLLLHLARNLAGTRLLVIGTYRDVEVDRAHPLSGTLADLRRVGEMPRVVLRGLTVDEVHRMINALQGQEVRWSFAEVVHRQTEGNPLFIQEALRYLVEEGFIVRKEGRWEGRWRETGEAPPELSIPEGLRDVVGKRLSRLSEQANQVLSVAAVIGREFRLDVLQQVAGLAEEPLIAALEEAQERAVIEERPETGGALVFRFTHAFFRQTLYEEIFAARRIRSHQQVARALEKVHARRLDEHAAEIAEHYSHSSDRRDLRKAVSFAERAAKRALSVFAYGEAVRHFETALKAQEVLDPEDRTKRCDLLLGLGEAMLPLEEPRRVADTVANEAFQLAEALVDQKRAVRAAIQALEALMRWAGNVAIPLSSPEMGQWASRADRYAQSGTVERIYADIGQGLFNLTRPAEAHIFLRNAVEQALEMGDNTAFFAAAGRGLANLRALQDRDLRRRLAYEVLSRPHEGIRSLALAQCLQNAEEVFLIYADREAAKRADDMLQQLAERTRDPGLALRGIGSIQMAVIDGRLTEAIALRDAGVARTKELGLAFPGSGAIRAYLLLGRIDELLARPEDPSRPGQAARILAMAHAGNTQEAVAKRAQFGDVGSVNDQSATHLLAALMESSLLCGDTDTVRALLPRLAPVADTIEPFQFLVSLGRLVGEASVLLAHPIDARESYERGFLACQRVRFRPEIALIRLDQAELLLDHYPDERREALDHLDFAIKEFEAMQMAPSLERARAVQARADG